MTIEYAIVLLFENNKIRTLKLKEKPDVSSHKESLIDAKKHKNSLDDEQYLRFNRKSFLWMVSSLTIFRIGTSGYYLFQYIDKYICYVNEQTELKYLIDNDTILNIVILK